MQCPRALLVEICFRKGEALGSENHETWRKEFEPDLYCVQSELIFMSNWKGCIIVKF
jgi:hypothetical protein